MFARTERLLLRPSWPEDAHELHEAIADEGIVRNLASAPWPYTADDAVHFTTQQHEALYPAFLLMLRTKGAPRLIGACGIGDLDGEAELGYWIARPYWGLGFATEASRAVIHIAKTVGHNKLIASHFTDNPASGNVLRKLGFQSTGKITQRQSKGRRDAAACAMYERSLNSASSEPHAMLRPPAFSMREQMERLQAA
ncbi:GNAT family N-acetyltransferase [Sphingorhabdus sp.]|uniref:GNAT family N-acetyltransferase n=1 Tax=Sphingorhabdus sp. TaxID=1902408 RepID=UPI0033404DA7